MIAYIILAVVIILTILAIMGMFLLKKEGKQIVEPSLKEKIADNLVESAQQVTEAANQMAVRAEQARRGYLDRMLAIGTNFNERIYGPFLTDDQYEAFYQEMKSFATA